MQWHRSSMQIQTLYNRAWLRSLLSVQPAGCRTNTCLWHYWQVASCRDSGGGDQPLAAGGPRGLLSQGGGGAASSMQLVNPNARRSARQRRQIRRKFEALERLLEVGEALMVPPPEEMLTQPPPVSS